VIRRLVTVLLDPSAGRRPPPGIDAEGWRAALAEDAADLVQGLVEVDGGILATEDDLEMARSVGWPRGNVWQIAEATLGCMVDSLGGCPYDELVIVTADAPDLPPLHLAKLFRALGSSSWAVIPERTPERADAAGCATSGIAAVRTDALNAVRPGVVAFAIRLPAVPAGGGWRDLTFDTASLPALRQVLGLPVAAAPAWHRLREPEDVARLDPGLEGWDLTRALLSGTSA
jgi:hypothetical protein